MNWNDVLTRLKDARTWSILVSIANALLLYFNVDSQLSLVVNLIIAAIAFVLFGVEPVLRAIRGRLL